MERNDFLKTLYEYCEGTLELRVFKQERMIERKFLATDAYLSMDAIAHKYKSCDIYYGVATRNGGGTKAHIKHIPAVWVDVDNPDQKALDASLAEFEVQPSIILFSGGGYHLYWLLKEPADKDDIHEIETINKALATALNGDLNACDASRILRPPGTINQKYDNKPNSYIVIHNDLRYDLSDFSQVSNKCLKFSESVQKVSNKCLKSVQNSEGQKNTLSKTVQNVSNSLSLIKGHRDHSIFHVANCLAKGGMSYTNAIEITKILAKSCEPEFDEKQAILKVNSAYKRASNTKEVLSKTVQNWVETADRTFTVQDICTECSINIYNKLYIYKILYRLCDKDIIEKSGNKRGVYRKKDTNRQIIDLAAAKVTPFLMQLPLGLSDLVTVYPGNILVFAGEQNAGKTAALLDIIKNNQHNHRVRYFSSEMGSSELRMRLELFKDMQYPDDWTFEPEERSTMFQDVIDPNAINVIDYLEITDNFFEIGKHISQIWEKLDQGVAVIALQKKRGTDLGRGAEFSLEKPRLYVSLSNEWPNHTARIVKGKNWATERNPNGLYRRFKIQEGCYLLPETDWSEPS